MHNPLPSRGAYVEAQRHGARREHGGGSLREASQWRTHEVSPITLGALAGQVVHWRRTKTTSIT